MLSVLILCAAVDVRHADDLKTALEHAKRLDAPILAYVHGSDWNRRGEVLLEEMWKTPETTSMLSGHNFVLLDVDILQSPSEDMAEAQKGMHNKWRKKGLLTYPAVIALAPDGTTLGSRQGDTLPRRNDLAREAVLELAKASSRSLTLHRIAVDAQTRGDASAEVDAIHRTIALPLDRPRALVKRLAEVDPEDPSGIRRRLTMPPWHNFVAQATKDAKEGRAVEALARLDSMLQEGVYIDEQEAWILVAIGSVHRHTQGHEAEARDAFKRAWDIDPKGLAGNAGKRLFLILYSDPSLAMGWRPQHCSTERTSWTLPDVPSELAPGTYTLTFTHTKGPHGLEIDLVEFFGSDSDAEEPVAIDSHIGFAGTKPNSNTFKLHLSEPLADPVIRIHCLSKGGTNSHGTITLSGPEPGS